MMGTTTKMWLQLCIVAGLSGSACQDPTAPANGSAEQTERAGKLPPFIESVVVSDSATIRLRLIRFAPGSGEVLVSSGIPLPPGMLRAGDLANVAIEVGGQMLPMHVAPLSGQHADGSLRAMLIQFRYAINAGPGFEVLLSLGRGVARPQPDPARVDPIYTVSNPLPEAAALPTNPAYLISTGIVGETVPAPSSFSTLYETNFSRWGDPKWLIMQAEFGTPQLDGNKITTYNYYDRALINYAWWVRTGDPEYWKRANYYLIPYRDWTRTANYVTQPHNVQIEGIEVHYLVTGDAQSFGAIEALGENQLDVWLKMMGQVQVEYMDNRIQARVLDMALTAHRLGVKSRNYAADARTALGRILGSQSEDGAYRLAGHCFQDTPFMNGLLNEALIRYYTYFEKDTRIPVALQKNLDFMWSKQWRPGDMAFVYLEADCAVAGGPDAAPDLNLLIANGYAWLARYSGDMGYRSKGDQIFQAGVLKSWLEGQKQFNESYLYSYRYLAYRP